VSEREAERWAELRVHGRLRYVVREGFRFAAGFGACLLLLHFSLNNSVPWTTPLAATLGTSAGYSALTFFRWNFQELRFFLFNQSQACS
jgi:hypothetical protein